MKKRKIEIAVISDVHLGTFGCHAEELHHYLKSIDPEILILNGDIIDIWAFKKSYFPKYHFKVIQQILKIASRGVPVYYITGNHDDALRKFSGTRIKNIRLEDKLLLKVGRTKMLFFHGDVFDSSIGNARWLAKIGGKGYDYLILLNRMINKFLLFIGRERISFSKRVKNSFKNAIKFISDFEKSAMELAAQSECQHVICGHIHTPKQTEVEIDGRKILYLNSGDWVENLTALEYKDKRWNIYKYEEDRSEKEIGQDEKMSVVGSPQMDSQIAAFTSLIYQSQPEEYANIIRYSGNR